MTPIRSVIPGLILIGACAGTLVAQAPATPPMKKDSSTAVDPHTAQPERPTVATHAGTATKGWLELESGVQVDHGPGSDRNVMAVTVAKLGVGERAQFSLSINAMKPTGSDGGFGDAAIGLKLRIVEDNPILGDFALQPSLKFPTGSALQGTGTGTTDASLLLISSRDVGPVHIDLNTGYTVRSGSAVPNQWVWTASFGGMFAPTLGWTAEVFGYPSAGMASGDPIVGLLFGPTFALRNWLVFDIGTIVPLTGDLPNSIYAGLTYNLGKIF